MIFKLKSYKADAEILGQIHEVEFTGDALVIRGVDLAAAGRVLERLTDHEVVGCGIPGSAREAVEAPKPELEKKYGNAVAVMPYPPQQEAPPAGSVPVERPPPEVEKDQQIEKDRAAPPPPPPPPPVSGGVLLSVKSVPTFAETSKTTPASTNGGVPDIVVNATKLKEIVDYLVAQGSKTPEAVLAEIARLKPHSPVLQRATEVENRVKKIMSMPG